MIEGKTISAVLFVHNEEEFISQQIESIFAQVSPVDQIIIVDDQSTDNTRMVIDYYCQKDERIRYFLNTHKGKIQAYQLGLSKVNTDLFFVCAGDDVLLPEFTNYMYSEVLIKHKVEYAYANCVITDKSLRPISFVRKKLFYITDELLHQNCLNGYLYGFSTLIKQITPLPPSLEFEDWFTAIKLSCLHGKSYLSDRPLFYYRKHGKNATSINHSKAKYFNSLQRNLTFYRAVLVSGLLDAKQMKFVRSTIMYHECLLNFKIKNGFKLLQNSNLTLRQKIKVVLNPLWLLIKYSKK